MKGLTQHVLPKPGWAWREWLPIINLSIWVWCGISWDSGPEHWNNSGYPGHSGGIQVTGCKILFVKFESDRIAICYRATCLPKLLDTMVWLVVFSRLIVLGVFNLHSLGVKSEEKLKGASYHNSHECDPDHEGPDT